MDPSRLPLPILEKFFTRSFNLNERLKLRLVCKRWKKLIDFFGKENLLICRRSSSPYEIKWADSKKRISLDADMLNIECFRAYEEPNEDFDRIDISNFLIRSLHKLCIFN